MSERNPEAEAFERSVLRMVVIGKYRRLRRRYKARFVHIGAKYWY